MLYLASFLAMLISLLIFMIDPVPVDIRRDEDAYAAEVYVVNFFTQHQAARDYLYHWLGRVYPLDSAKTEGYNGAFVNTQDVQAVALPGEALDNAMQLAGNMTVERGVANDGDVKGHLSASAVNSGTYLSGLVCLDGTSNTLVQCYKYRCAVNGANCTENCDACSSSLDIQQISFRSGVTPYVITYSAYSMKDKDDQPDWWRAHGQKRELRHEAWHKAMAKLSHYSHNCGMIVEAPSGYSWHETPAAGRKPSQYSLQLGNAGQQYCLDNGQRCTRFIPAGILTALQAFVGAGANLDGVLLCLSPVKDPYATVAVPTYHLDGIDNMAKGAGSHLSTENWYPVNGSSVRDGLDSNRWSDKFYQTDSANGLTLSSVPYTNDEFTLSFVVNHTDKSEGWLVGPSVQAPNADPDAGNFGLYQDSEGKFWFYPSRDLMTGIEIKDTNQDGEHFLNQGTHAWTIMRKDDRMYLYVDGWRVCENDTDNGWEAQTDGAGVGKPIVFGGLMSNTSIANVRYYATALNAIQIKKNFEVDRRRFGVSKLTNVDANVIGNGMCRVQ